MAQFRLTVNKQRVFVSRIFSVAVYNVHSQLQITSCTNSHKQTKQLLKFLPSSQCINNDLSLTKDSRISKQSTNLIEDGKDYLIDNSLQQKTSLLNKTLPGDKLITSTQLALMSLSYDEKWCKQFRITYNNAMKSRDLLGYSNNARAIKDITFPCEEFQVQQDRIRRVKRDNSSPDKVSSNVVMFTHYCKDLTTQKEKNNKADVKCDPLSLATVYQTLRDEIPSFFHKGHGFELYHKNVKFVNGLTNTTFSGLRTYKCVMTSMRLAAQMYLSDIRMDILKITKDSKDCNIKVRWRASGIPRYMVITGYPKGGDSCRYIDGFSIFDVDVNGLVYCHRLLKLMPSQSPQKDGSYNPWWVLSTAARTTLLQQQKSFEVLARHRVKDIEEACFRF